MKLKVESFHYLSLLVKDLLYIYGLILKEQSNVYEHEAVNLFEDLSLLVLNCSLVQQLAQEGIELKEALDININPSVLLNGYERTCQGDNGSILLCELAWVVVESEGLDGLHVSVEVLGCLEEQEVMTHTSVPCCFL
jgi:hypothetical protein